jgi:hypothetical protein
LKAAWCACGFQYQRAENTLRADNLGDKLLRIVDLEAVGAKALQQRHTQAHARVAHNDRLRGAPLAVRKFAHRDIIDFCGKGRAVVEKHAQSSRPTGDVGGGNGVPAWAKHIQRRPSRKKTPAAIRARSPASPCANQPPRFRETVNDFIQHLAWIFNNIKNSSHGFAPLFYRTGQLLRS